MVSLHSLLKVLAPLVEVDLFVVVHVGGSESLLDVDDLVSLQVQLLHQLLVVLLRRAAIWLNYSTKHGRNFCGHYLIISIRCVVLKF